MNNGTIENTMAVWVITPNGYNLAVTLKTHFHHARIFVSERIRQNLSTSTELQGFEKLSHAIHHNFESFDAHIFIFSTGIAVRMIAPLLKSKLSDPAVIVLDDQANHAISLVSGHLGGANALAQKIGALTGARPVITTATDVNALPAIDMIAQQAGLIIENPSMIKTINMAFLEHRKIRIIDPYDQITGRIPSDLIETSPDNGTFSGPAIFCSDQLTIGEIPRETLLLRPLSLVIGIGCNRGTTLDEIAGFLFETLNQRALCSLSIKLLATTTLKQDETGILKLSELIGRPIEFFSKEALNSVKTIQPPSAMVLKHIGVKSVCEAAAILASGSNLIIPKVKTKNVTIAVARVLPDSLCSVPGREI